MKNFHDIKIAKDVLTRGLTPPEAPTWDKAERLFVEAFGGARVKREKNGITLHFDLSAKREMLQSERLKNLAGYKKITCFWLPDREKMTTEAFIPLDQDVSKIVSIAERMAAPRIAEKPDGEVQRSIVRGDPEYIFEERTHVPWMESTGSLYGEKILAPILPAVDEATRTKAEYALAYVLEPAGGTDSSMQEWLALQRSAEKKKAAEPRMAVPHRWTHKEGIGRMKDAEFSAMQTSLPKIFSRS